MPTHNSYISMIKKKQKLFGTKKHVSTISINCVSEIPDVPHEVTVSWAAVSCEGSELEGVAINGLSRLNVLC